MPVSRMIAYGVSFILKGPCHTQAIINLKVLRKQTKDQISTRFTYLEMSFLLCRIGYLHNSFASELTVAKDTNMQTSTL